MDKLLDYINQRMKDINISLSDDLISEDDKTYLIGQKDELEAVLSVIYED